MGLDRKVHKKYRHEKIKNINKIKIKIKIKIKTKTKIKTN